MIRVLIAEDSPTVRELLAEILDGDPQLRVIGQARNGAEAVELACQLKPDLITMDIHMPVMDGFEATREIMVRAPTPILIVSSSVNGREMDLSMNALQAGALAVVQKPDNPASLRFNGNREELLSMAKAMAQVKVVRRWAARSPRPERPAARPLSGRGVPTVPLRLVAIAASTGGPAALLHILQGLTAAFRLPVLIVQHIASGFVGGLADWLTATSGLPVKVGEPGEPIRPRTAYLAPDASHLGVDPEGRLLITSSPPVNGFRPSGTVLFESAARSYGASLAAVILTGMGNDGVEGLKAVKAAGGLVLAQDQASSVVYGMPREALAAGVVDTVVSLDELPSQLMDLAAGGVYDTHPRR
jgi:two-component system, chemotaxis family, protein-glutamate methylesterase/glutaminase